MGNFNFCCYGKRDGKEPKKKCVFIIGPPGSGKTKFYEKLIKNGRSDFSFEDINAIDLEESIVTREECIKEFQERYDKITKNNKSIISLIVSVKFERTDIMKRNLLSVIKYFQRFNDLILIVVTHFDYSENQEQDKVHLKESLKYLLKNNADRVLFRDNSDENDEQLSKDLSKILKDIDENKQQSFTLENTIFEKIDENQQQNLLRDFKLYLQSLKQ